MTNEPSGANLGAEVLTDMRYDAWGCDPFDMLDAYIASRAGEHKAGINKLGVRWDEQYDLPPGGYKQQYGLEKDIDLGMIRSDANRILQAGNDQEALEQLRVEAMKNLKEHWDDSAADSTHTNFDANRETVITNTEAAKANAKGILQVADSIQKLLADKQRITKETLTKLLDSIKQNAQDFDKKCESAAKNVCDTSPDAYRAESAEWMVTSQRNDGKGKILTDLLNDQGAIRNHIFQPGPDDDPSAKDRMRKIYWDGGPPTTYRWDIASSFDRYLNGEELTRLKEQVGERLDEPGGHSRKYYVENKGGSEYQIWEREHVVEDMQHVMGFLDAACQQLLQINHDTKKHISEQYAVMAGYLDDINTVKPAMPGDPGSSAQPSGASEARGGAAGASGGAGGGGSAGAEENGPSSVSEPSSETDASSGMPGGADGPGSGGGGGDPGSALGSVGQALGSAGQSLGQAASGFGSALGGGLQGLMGSLGQIIQAAVQAAEQHTQQGQADDAENEDEQDASGGEDRSEADGQDEGSAEAADAQDGGPKSGEAPPGGRHAAPVPPAAHAAPPAATVPAGMGRAPAAQANADSARKQSDNNHGDFEVQAEVQQVGPNAGNQGHITGFE
ncbi:hypothetical protein [Segniliparus rugosus]|uniref:Uncharacterized protein n=1 Tax=Segniliparus rugosus (strain ATCC BAA-974 / DSM 45345 / CCUG 50838 / CIP 108380 / JCM 13579 / CDC 945) TaxID=679197 RepID=U1N5L6_SEGRC|nr:hypothetical protein [Segniliparus rugosus]ERG69424.1 hypothetical protein HMPREF9336_04120 [Segniliparus rugosus ATCC BAA-974]